jgi:hypothetical protein
MIKYSLLFVGVMSVSQAFAGGPPTRQDYFDCYQGFNGFPIRSSESGFEKPFFIISILKGEEHKGKDTLMILNPNGAQEILTDARPFGGTSKRELLSIQPVGETTKIETDFYTFPHHEHQDKQNWTGREDDAEYQKSMMHQNVIAEKIEVRTLFSDEEETFLKFGAMNKLAENEAQLKNGGLKGYLLDDLKNHTSAKEAQIQDSVKKLEACNKFPNDVDLQTAKMAQYRLIAAEQELIDQLNAKPAVGRPNGLKPSSSVVSPAQ